MKVVKEFPILRHFEAEPKNCLDLQNLARLRFAQYNVKFLDNSINKVCTKIFSLFFILAATAACTFAETYTYHLNTNDSYVLFVDAKIVNYSMSSPDMIDFQILSDIANSKTTVILSSKTAGSAKLTVTTAAGQDIYNLIIDNKDDEKNYNDNFYKLDMPPDEVMES